MALSKFLPYMILLIILMSASEELTGPNVCGESVNARLSESVLETYTDPNCHGHEIPCQKTRYITAYFMGLKTVLFCCEGWSRTGNNCTQPCPTNTYGRGCNQICSCTNVNSYCNPHLRCLCLSGYKSPNCSAPCDEGTYGHNCGIICTCLNGATCDVVNGSCSCTPGWMGVDCNTTCPDGRYGADCVGKCSCGTGFTCDPVTGDCTLLSPDPTKPGNDTADVHLLWKVIVPVLGCITVVTIIVACILCCTIIRQKKLIYSLTKRSESKDQTPARDDPGNSQSGIQLTSRVLVQSTDQEPDKAGTSDVQYQTRIAPSTVVELHAREAAPGPSSQSTSHTNQPKPRPSVQQRQEISREEETPLYCGVDDNDETSARRIQGFSSQLEPSANNLGGPQSSRLQKIEHTYFTKD